MTRFRPIVVSVLLCLAPALAVAQSRPAEDEATLRRLIEQTGAAIRAHDVDALMATYSKDVLVSYPGIPDTTYDGFYKSYRDMMDPAIETNAVPTVDEVVVSGDLATIRMMWNTTITDKKSGRKSSRQAKDLQIWRRENGSWKFFRGMWHHIRPDAPRPYLIAISVPNLDESIAWYERMLGFNVVRTIPVPDQRMRIAIIEREGVRFELVELGGSTPPSTLLPKSGGNPALIQGVGKVAFYVADIDAWATSFREKGARFQIEPAMGKEARTFIVLDNNGNWLQFTAQ